jgi:hypothetical protein
MVTFEIPVYDSHCFRLVLCLNVSVAGCSVGSVHVWLSSSSIECVLPFDNNPST